MLMYPFHRVSENVWRLETLQDDYFDLSENNQIQDIESLGEHLNLADCVLTIQFSSEMQSSFTIKIENNNQEIIQEIDLANLSCEGKILLPLHEDEIYAVKLQLNEENSKISGSTCTKENIWCYH
ncbi:MAG: hypothetical protein GF411_00045 [Candidatus Lokiarchaeota archaeon]|nr:hypothetical protein [Candidatus Lokiarchaeota archaeon]